MRLLIGKEGGDSSGKRESDEPSQRTRRVGDGSSLTPQNASAWIGNQPFQ